MTRRFVPILFLLLTAGMVAATRPADPFVALNLGELRGGRSSQAEAISASGEVVGFSSIPDDVEDSDAFHAFLWSREHGMTDLGTLTGSHRSRAIAINDNGVVAGLSYFPNTSVFRAFVWTRADGILLDLGTLGGRASQPMAMNSNGDVVGYSYTQEFPGEEPGNQPTHAFLWTRNGGMIDLGTLGGRSSQANAINDDGVVVGVSGTAPHDVPHAFMWTRYAGMVDLGALSELGSAAQAVSDEGVVVGQSQVDSGEYHAFVWTQHTGMVDIGIGTEGLDGFGERPASFGEKINGRFAIGHISATDDASHTHAFAWSRRHGFIDIGTLDDYASSLATAVNPRGVVVGNSFTPGKPIFRAFAWSASTRIIVPLTTPSGLSSQANAINNNVIVGSICSEDRTCHATLWKPSPR
jgi:probable HAF family extracellular repeat protein